MLARILRSIGLLVAKLGLGFAAMALKAKKELLTIRIPR